MNGQAKIDFEKQFCGIIPANKTELYAYYIEWFDSVGIKILPCYGISGWYCEVKNFNNKEFGNYKCFLIVKKSKNDFQTRQQANEKAIEKAIILYNNRFKNNNKFKND